MTNVVDGQKLYEEFTHGELPACVECVSYDGKPCSMEIDSISLTVNGEERIVQDKPIVLGTNAISGDTKFSKVTLQIPFDESKDGKVDIVGDAYVRGLNRTPYKPDLPNGKKNMTVYGNKRSDGSNSLFARFRIEYQKNGKYEFFGILFGEQHKEEKMTPNGNNRPHVAFYTDGNGKFCRLGSYTCEIISELLLRRGTDEFFPRQIEIILEDYAETLQIDFVYDHNIRTVSIVDAKFILH